VVAKGGKFLEAPVSGSKGPAAMGALIFLAGGDQGLYESVVGDELDLMGKASFHFGPVGSGTKMKLVVNMTMGSMLTCLAEGAALAEASSLSTGQLLEVLDLGVMSNLMFRLKGPNMLKRKHTTHFPLKHAQKDMRFALALGDDLGQALPLAAAANEAMKRARSLGHGDDDFSSVYEASRLAPAEQPVAVLFDFDGTLGDTETPAMEMYVCSGRQGQEGRKEGRHKRRKELAGGGVPVK
jgi:glyoxylate/succinic semialdehyde reductase